MYRIYWRSLITGATGRVTKTFPYDEAVRIKNYLNEENRKVLVHWIELDNNEKEIENDKSD